MGYHFIFGFKRGSLPCVRYGLVSASCLSSEKLGRVTLMRQGDFSGCEARCLPGCLGKAWQLQGSHQVDGGSQKERRV